MSQIHRANLWKIFQLGVDKDSIKANQLIEEILAYIPESQMKFRSAGTTHHIHLIKLLREIFALGLKESKEIADGGVLLPNHQSPAIVKFLRDNNLFL